MQTSLSGMTALVTGATAGIGRATALALADLGATVVAPGPTRTEGTAAFGEGFAGAAESVALRRIAEPEEIADAIAFNGAVLSVSGGTREPKTGPRRRQRRN